MSIVEHWSTSFEQCLIDADPALFASLGVTTRVDLSKNAINKI